MNLFILFLLEDSFEMNHWNNYVAVNHFNYDFVGVPNGFVLFD